MSNMSKPQDQEHEHIPTQTKNEDAENENSGSGGLLSAIGDPAGSFLFLLTSSSPLYSFPYTIPHTSSHLLTLLFPFPSLPSTTPLTTPPGKVLHTTLRPIGAPLEKGVTGPLGNALGGTTRGVLGPLMGNEEERMEVVGGKNRDSYDSGPDKIGGKKQTGENPLGLDQSGRWGFEESSLGGSGGGGDGAEGKKKEAGGGNPLGL